MQGEKTGLCKKQFLNGLLKENPTFVLMLGMCPTMAVTAYAVYGLGMGISTMIVLTLSNMMISALRNIIPDKVRIPAFICIIASFVTIVQFLLKAYVPALNDALGAFIPLIVVNCIVLGRAESFASKNKVIPSMFDGLGMGLGFTVALTLIGMIREFLGNGSFFFMKIPVLCDNSIKIFIMAPGAFFVLATLTAIQNVIKKRGEARGKDMSKIQSGGCGQDCLNCADSSCEHKFFDENGVDGPVGKKDEIKKAQAEAKEAKKVEPKKEDAETKAAKTEEIKKDDAETKTAKTEEIKEDAETKVTEKATSEEKNEAKEDK